MLAYRSCVRFTMYNALILIQFSPLNLFPENIIYCKVNIWCLPVDERLVTSHPVLYIINNINNNMSLLI